MTADEENITAVEEMETPKAETTETTQENVAPPPNQAVSIRKSRRKSMEPPKPTSKNVPEGAGSGGKWYLQRYRGSTTDSMLIPAFIFFIVPGILLIMYPIDQRLVYQDPGGALYDESGRKVPPGKTRPLKDDTVLLP
jgi:hypothetical protein